MRAGTEKAVVRLLSHGAPGTRDCDVCHNHPRRESPNGVRSPRSLTTGRRPPSPCRSGADPQAPWTYPGRDPVTPGQPSFAVPRRRPGREEHHVGGFDRRPVGVSSDHPFADRHAPGSCCCHRVDPRHRPSQPHLRRDRLHPDVAIRASLATDERSRVGGAQGPSRLIDRHAGHLQPGRVRRPDDLRQGTRIRSHRRRLLPL